MLVGGLVKYDHFLIFVLLWRDRMNFDDMRLNKSLQIFVDMRLK